MKRGAHGIRGLGIVFRRMDNSGNRKLDRHEFEWGIKENGHNLSRAVGSYFKINDLLRKWKGYSNILIRTAMETLIITSF